MRLIIGGAQLLVHLDDAAISDAVRDVAGLGLWDYGPDPFIILDQGPGPERELSYMQAYWHSSCREDDIGGFLLEYQDGSIEEHYECFPVSVEETTEAFIEYLHGGAEWKERFNWERTELETGLT